MRTVAVVAGLSLLLSGSSAIVKKPGAASTVADISFFVGGAVMTPHVLCEATEDHCMGSGIVANTFGVPILLVGAIAGLVALSNDAQQKKADAAAKAENCRILDGERGVTARSRVGRAVVPALQTHAVCASLPPLPLLAC